MAHKRRRIEDCPDEALSDDDADFAVPRWLQYEKACLLYHKIKFNAPFSYHWPDIPELLLEEAGWKDWNDHRERKRDKGLANAFLEVGLDGISKRDSGLIELIQVKTSTVVNANAVGSFNMTLQLCEKRNQNTAGVFYHSGRLTRLVKRNFFEFNRLTINISLEQIQKYCAHSSNSEEREEEEKLGVTLAEQPLWPHQHEAIAALQAWFQDSNEIRGVVSMPCGTGKTRTCLAFLDSFPQNPDNVPWNIMILVPTRVLCEQWFCTTTEFFNTNGTIAIIQRLSCDHNPRRVTIFDTSDTSGIRFRILVCVNDSAYLTNDFDFDFTVIDEAHLSIRDQDPTLWDDSPTEQADEDADSDAGSEDTSDECDLDSETDDDDSSEIESDSTNDENRPVDARLSAMKTWVTRHFLSMPKVLLLSATPPKGYHSIFKYTEERALAEKRIVDYRICYPVCDPVYETSPSVSWTDDPDFSLRAMWMASNVERLGIRACIVYVTRTVDIVPFVEKLRAEFTSHGRPHWIQEFTTQSVHGSDEMRQSWLTRFDSPPEDAPPGEVRILIAVRMLDTGIDLNSCDSVFLAMLPAQITTYWRIYVQRIGRCCRLDPSRPEKTAHILFWADEAHATKLMFELAVDGLVLPNNIVSTAIDYGSPVQRSAETPMSRRLERAYRMGPPRILKSITLVQIVDEFIKRFQNSRPRLNDGRIYVEEWKCALNFFHFYDRIRPNFSKLIRSKRRSRWLLLPSHITNVIKERCSWITRAIEAMELQILSLDATDSDLYNFINLHKRIPKLKETWTDILNGNSIKNVCKKLREIKRIFYETGNIEDDNLKTILQSLGILKKWEEAKGLRPATDEDVLNFIASEKRLPNETRCCITLPDNSVKLVNFKVKLFRLQRDFKSIGIIKNAELHETLMQMGILNKWTLDKEARENRLKTTRTATYDDLVDFLTTESRMPSREGYPDVVWPVEDGKTVNIYVKMYGVKLAFWKTGIIPHSGLSELLSQMGILAKWREDPEMIKKKREKFKRTSYEDLLRFIQEKKRIPTPQDNDWQTQDQDGVLKISCIHTFLKTLKKKFWVTQTVENSDLEDQLESMGVLSSWRSDLETHRKLQEITRPATNDDVWSFISSTQRLPTTSDRKWRISDSSGTEKSLDIYGKIRRIKEDFLKTDELEPAGLKSYLSKTGILEMWKEKKAKSDSFDKLNNKDYEVKCDLLIQYFERNLKYPSRRCEYAIEDTGKKVKLGVFWSQLKGHIFPNVLTRISIDSHLVDKVRNTIIKLGITPVPPPIE
jgi:superfamily II DNA or RNA helicase